MEARHGRTAILAALCAHRPVWPDRPTLTDSIALYYQGRTGQTGVGNWPAHYAQGNGGNVAQAHPIAGITRRRCEEGMALQERKTGGGDPESNRRTRLCRPLHHHSATPPWMARHAGASCCGPQCSGKWKSLQGAARTAAPAPAPVSRRSRPWPTGRSSAGQPCRSARFATRASRYAIRWLPGYRPPPRAKHNRRSTPDT